MSILQRYLTAALVKNGLFTFAVLASIISMMVFSMVALRESLSFLTFKALLQVAGLLTSTQIQVLIPLTSLTATIWTYSHFQRSGELTAMRGAGVSLRNLILPGMLLGTLSMATLAALQDRVIPEANYSQRIIGKRFLAASIDRFLEDDRRAIQDARFKCRWSHVVHDESRHPSLMEFTVAELGDTPSSPPVFTRAERAEPWIDERDGSLVLELRDLTYDTIGASDSMRIALDLSAVSEESAPRRKIKHLRYDELFTRARRFRGRPAGHEALSELHGRAATAASALLFAVLGALLGVVYEMRNRAYVFVVGFLLVLGLNYAPGFVGHALSRNGAVPPGVAMWMGNILTFVFTLRILKRARQR